MAAVVWAPVRGCRRRPSSFSETHRSGRRSVVAAFGLVPARSRARGYQDSGDRRETGAAGSRLRY